MNEISIRSTWQEEYDGAYIISVMLKWQNFTITNRT